MTDAVGIQDHPWRKLGLRPPDPVALARMLRFRLTGAIPAHPVTADHLSAVPAWNGATNFSYGTCGPVSAANMAILTWWWCLGELISVSDDAIFDLYRRSGNPDFDPVTDEDDLGVDMTTMLSALKAGGIEITHADGTTEVVKPIVYGAVATGIDTVRAVTSIFGGAILAGTLDVAQQSQTDAGLWDYKSGSGVWGGHAFMGGKYTSSAVAHTADETVITWMQMCGFTDTFWAHQGEEAYVPVFRPLYDHPAFQAGVDQAALKADFLAVTGQPLPDPGPPPAPVPPVPDTATPADHQLWDADKDNAQGWCRGTRTRPDLVLLKAALRRWAAALGLPL